MVLCLALHSLTSPSGATVPFNVILLQVGDPRAVIVALGAREPLDFAATARPACCRLAWRCCRSRRCLCRPVGPLGGAPALSCPSSQVKPARRCRRHHFRLRPYNSGLLPSALPTGLRAEQEDARGAAVPAGGAALAWCPAAERCGGTRPYHHCRLAAPCRSWCPPAAACPPACGTPAARTS